MVVYCRGVDMATALRTRLLTRVSVTVDYVVTYLLVLIVYGVFLGVEYSLLWLVEWVLEEEMHTSPVVATAFRTARLTLAFTILGLSVVHGLIAAVEQFRAERRVAAETVEI
jgi:disulfide bond formation protein DsbB